jgi:hypothetical protein
MIMRVTTMRFLIRLLLVNLMTPWTRLLIVKPILQMITVVLFLSFNKDHKSFLAQAAERCQKKVSLS